MIDIFYPKDEQEVLRGKHVVFLGDSNVRAIYKDLLLLSQQTRFLSVNERKAKMEKSFCGDQLIYHGERYNGRNYREERYAESQGCKFSFCFLTRVYDDYVKEKLEKFTSVSHEPDVFVIHSCLWDVSRWGPGGVDEYKVNLKNLMKQLQKILSPKCLVIWLTCPPIASELKGGFLVKQLEFLKYSLRFHVMEANNYAHKVVVSHGFDVLDVHYHFKMQLLQRAEDGIHWQSPAVRYLTNLLLTHMCLAWGIPLPHRYQCTALQQSLDDGVGDVVESKKLKTEEKVDSLPVKKSTSAEAAENKENCTTPKTSKKKRHTSKWRKNIAKSHHAFMLHRQYADRKRRIRQWQSEKFTQSSPYSPQVQFEVTMPSSPFNFQSPQVQFEVTMPSSPFNFQLQSKIPLHSPAFNPQLQSEMAGPSSRFNPKWQSEMSPCSPYKTPILPHPQLKTRMPLLSSPFRPQLQYKMSPFASPFNHQRSPCFTNPSANYFPVPSSPYINGASDCNVPSPISEMRPEFNPFV